MKQLSNFQLESILVQLFLEKNSKLRNPHTFNSEQFLKKQNLLQDINTFSKFKSKEVFKSLVNSHFKSLCSYSYSDSLYEYAQEDFFYICNLKQEYYLLSNDNPYLYKCLGLEQSNTTLATNLNSILADINSHISCYFKPVNTSITDPVTAINVFFDSFNENYMNICCLKLSFAANKTLSTILNNIIKEPQTAKAQKASCLFYKLACSILILNSTISFPLEHYHISIDDETNEPCIYLSYFEPSYTESDTHDTDYFEELLLDIDSCLYQLSIL